MNDNSKCRIQAISFVYLCVCGKTLIHYLDQIGRKCEYCGSEDMRTRKHTETIDPAGVLQMTMNREGRP